MKIAEQPALFRRSRAYLSRGFLLLETLVGVSIFAIGVLVLARCLNHCIDAELIKRQDQIARQVLENRMAEIEGGAVAVEDTPKEEKLEGRFAGFTLRQSRTKLDLKNEDDEELAGLYAVTLQTSWAIPGGVQSKELHFYVFSAQ